MKAKTSKAALLVMISISFVLLASLGAAVHAATRAGDKYIIDENLFPDSAFRQYVLDTIDENKSGTLEDFERNQVTNILLSGGYNGKKIYDLTGIEHFPNLTYLDCSNNQLTSLDLSNNPSLTRLECVSNQLSSLDLTNNPNLEILYCYSNRLTSLDVTKNNDLTELWCYNNQLTELDVSNQPNLERVECSHNKITTLNAANTPKLKMLYCNWSYTLSGLNISNTPALEDLRVMSGKLSNIDVSESPKLKSFYCSSNALTNLDVSKSTALTELSCGSNHLLSLDVSKNTSLSTLKASGQTRILSVPLDGYDLSQTDPNINGSKISNVNGAAFHDTFMENYKKGTNVTYAYDTGNGKTMDVTLTLEIETVISNISYKDGNNNFTNWKAGYTAPITYEEGTGVTLPTSDNVEKEGYIFAGWYDNEKFTGEPIDILDDSVRGNVVLYAKWVPERFSVTIPKRITLSGETKSGTYTVTCTGAIGDSRYISVVPDSSFTMTQKGKADITATTLQQITKFRSADYTGSLEADETEMGTDIEGTIHTPDLTAGSWNGTFNFRINLI